MNLAISTASMSARADAFVTARHTGRDIPDYPGEPPETLADAYATQSVAIDRWPDVIGGWKVARINGPWRERVAATTRFSSARSAGQTRCQIISRRGDR